MQDPHAGFAPPPPPPPPRLVPLPSPLTFTPHLHPSPSPLTFTPHQSPLPPLPSQDELAEGKAKVDGVQMAVKSAEANAAKQISEERRQFQKELERAKKSVEELTAEVWKPPAKSEVQWEKGRPWDGQGGGGVEGAEGRVLEGTGEGVLAQGDGNIALGAQHGGAEIEKHCCLGPVPAPSPPPSLSSLLPSLLTQVAADKKRAASLSEKFAQREDVIVELRARMDEYERGVHGLREEVQEKERYKAILETRDEEVRRMVTERNRRESQLADLVDEVQWLREKAGVKQGDEGTLDLKELRLKAQVRPPPPPPPNALPRQLIQSHQP